MGRQHIILTVTLVFTVLSFSRCKEDRISTSKQNGIILWSGPVAADGCDWLIKIDNESFHSDNLPDNFKKDGMKVKIKYSIKPPANDFFCGIAASSYRTIDIESISKK